VVFVGLISYSLYLWHWPILAFEDVVPLFTKMSTHSKGGKFIFLVVTISIATLSWRFIETPFRKGQFRPQRKTLFVLTGAAVAVLVCCGLGLLAVHGVPAGFPQEALALTKYSHYDSDTEWRRNVCFFTPDTNFSNFNSSVCLQNDPARKQFLLIGDSHAADLYPGLSRVFSDANVSQINASFCPPLVTEPLLRPEFRPNCGKLSHFVYGDYLLRHRVDTVILSAFWEESQLPELGRTVAWIQQHGMKVVVFGPAIEYSLPLPRILIAALRDRQPGQIAVREQTDARHLDVVMARMARQVWKVPYISFFETLCAPQREPVLKTQAGGQPGCPVYAGPGVPVLFDTNHFTAEGSVLYAKAVRDKVLLPQ
jgi:SGNH domain (fused to AT3 domains)